jgi:HSP20 family protein
MAEPTKLPIKREERATQTSFGAESWSAPFENLRQEINRLLDDFDGRSWNWRLRHPVFDIRPYWLRQNTWAMSPAVDVIETDKAYELTAELPGLDEKNVEVKLSNSQLTIKGEKQAEKEEKKKDYYLRERQFGSFERVLQVPDGVDADKIEADFTKGVLHVTLPKTPEAQKAERKIPVKAA